MVHSKSQSRSKQYPEKVYDVWLREKGICWLCQLKVPFKTAIHGLRPTREHVRQARDGGSNMPENIKLTHLSCNSMRDHYSDYEMRDKIRALAAHSGTEV